MTHVTCRLTAKNRDQLRNPTLGNRVWATFSFLPYSGVAKKFFRGSKSFRSGGQKSPIWVQGQNPGGGPGASWRLYNNNVWNFNQRITPLCKIMNNTVRLKACLLFTLKAIAVTDLAGRQHQVNEFHCSVGCSPEISETRVLRLQ